MNDNSTKARQGTTHLTKGPGGISTVPKLFPLSTGAGRGYINQGEVGNGFFFIAIRQIKQIRTSS